MQQAAWNVRQSRQENRVELRVGTSVDKVVNEPPRRRDISAFCRLAFVAGSADRF
jgi:hypothetical protein